MYRSLFLFGSVLASTTLAHSQTTFRVSVDSAGVQANGSSGGGVISADRRFVAFSSSASNLVAGDTNLTSDVFVHDLQTDETTRVSVGPAGEQGNEHSVEPAISADGRYVAFSSRANTFVPNDTNAQYDIFVTDRQTGAIERVNVTSAGAETGHSQNASISADGRYVAFLSLSPSLVPNDTNGANDAFVHDRLTGITTRVSVATGGAQASALSTGSTTSISADGRYVAFESNDPVLGSANNRSDVFVHDRQTGQTTLVSVNSGGTDGNEHSEEPSLSASGRVIAFTSLASDLITGDTNDRRDIYVRDLQTGTTTRESFNSAQDAVHPRISADGRFVLYSTLAGLVVPGDTNGEVDAFVKDRLTGTTTRVSVDSNGAEGLGRSVGSSISPDGRMIVFESDAPNLVANDTNGEDVFVHDRTVAPDGGYCFGDGSSELCPCANAGWSDHGCRNSIYASGAQLAYFGNASVGSDTLVLTASSMSGNTSLYFQGSGTADVPFDDGKICVGGTLLRVGLKGVAGGSSWNPTELDSPISVKGALPPAGGTRHYQVVYRNSDPSFCTPATTNRTNGVTVVWVP